MNIKAYQWDYKKNQGIKISSNQKRVKDFADTLAKTCKELFGQCLISLSVFFAGDTDTYPYHYVGILEDGRKVYAP